MRFLASLRFIAALCVLTSGAPDTLAQERRETFCLVTHYSDPNAAFAETARRNQATYAAKWNYGFAPFFGRLSDAAFVDANCGDLEDLYGGGLFWQKVIALERTLAEGATTARGEPVTCAWVMWMDADAMVTQTSVSIDEIVRTYAQRTTARGVAVDVILSKEDDHPVNAGVFFVRHSPGGVSFLAALRELYPLYKENFLPEQTAMATLAHVLEPWPSNQVSREVAPGVHPAFVIAPQRAFNSFYDTGSRFSYRARWQPGDFVAHLAGVSKEERARLMNHIAAFFVR